MKLKDAMDKKEYTPKDMVKAKIVKSNSYALRIYKGQIPSSRVATLLEHWLFPYCDFDEIMRPWKYFKKEKYKWRYAKSVKQWKSLIK